MSENVEITPFIEVNGSHWRCFRPISDQCTGWEEASHAHAVERAEAHAVYHNSVESRT